MLQTAAALHHPIYNVGSGAWSCNRDFVAAIRHVVPDAELGLPPEFDGAPSSRPDSALDSARLCEATGYAPRFVPLSAVRDYVAWLRAGNAS